MSDKEILQEMLVRNRIAFETSQSGRIAVGDCVFVFDGANRLTEIDGQNEYSVSYVE